jgi:hypothetical protein
VANIQGTFSTSETISSSNTLDYATAATGTVGTVTTKALGGTLISNFNGDIQLLFNKDEVFGLSVSQNGHAFCSKIMKQINVNDIFNIK